MASDHAKPARRVKPTIKDVATVAGVSFKTVSRVLNNAPSVSPDTAIRVRAAARSMGFVMNSAARQLKGVRSQSLGMVVMARGHWQWTADLVSGAVARSLQRGYGLVPYMLGSYDEGERETLLKLVAERAVDGVLLTTPWSEIADLHAALVELDMPFALVPAAVGSRFNAARADEELAAYLVTRHLVDLGHRRFGLIAGQPQIDMTRQRVAGIERGLREAGLLLAEEFRFVCDYEAATGVDGVRRLLSLREPPTAIVCLSDTLAAAAMKTAQEAGICLPRQLSIAGIGDFALASLVYPGLTTVAVPTAEMAGAAIDLLIDTIEGARSTPGEKIFPPRLVVRQSTAPPPAG